MHITIHKVNYETKTQQSVSIRFDDFNLMQRYYKDLDNINKMLNLDLIITFLPFEEDKEEDL